MTMDNSESNLAIRDAVQTTLNQFADSVRAGFDGLRDQLKQEQTGRTLLTELAVASKTPMIGSPELCRRSSRACRPWSKRQWRRQFGRR
jgi:hypothetical protein